MSASLPTSPAVLSDDDFDRLVEPHRRELHVHCYRMLGSFDEAEDQVQETLLRAWRGRATYAGRASLRTWLHRIATNACLDALQRRPRPRLDGSAEVAWLQPYPDELLAELPDDRGGPHASAEDRETIELAFLVAVQHLPPRTRAVLLARDVLGWSARETADALGITVAAANSALQRARAALRRHLPERRADWSFGQAADDERQLVRRYVEASERGDADGLAALLTPDAAFTMPPHPGRWRGRDAIVGMWVECGFADLGLRCRTLRANGQPAVACYGLADGRHRALAIDVLRIVDGRVADILAFDARVFPAFGLPDELPAG